jgi:hypothetical protein
MAKKQQWWMSKVKMSMNEIPRVTLQARSRNCERRLLALSCLSGSPSCLSVRMLLRSSVRGSAWNSTAPAGWILIKFYICYFRKSVANIKISLKPNKNEVYFTWSVLNMKTNINYDKTRSIVVWIKNVSDKRVEEKKHFVFNNCFFSKIGSFAR